MECNDLYHHGVKGQKWGIRRTPEQLVRARGSSTPKYSEPKRVKKPETKPAAKSTSSSSSSRPSKTVKEMNDEELNRAIRRLQMEKQYRELNPPTVSRGKRFVDQVIAPAAKEAGKNLMKDYLTKVGKEYLGLNDKNTTDALRKEVERLRLQKEFKDLTRDNSLRDEVTRLALEKQLKALQAEREDK
jgi:hypothetical protein